MQHQYWPQAAYAQPYAQPMAYAQQAGAYAAQPSAAAAAAAYNPYAAQQQYQQYQQQQMLAMHQQQQQQQQAAAAAFQPGFRTGGGAAQHDYSDYYQGHAFDNRSAGSSDSRHGGARGVLPPKAKAWQHKVTHYAKTHGISLKAAMIKLKGTGTGSRTSKRRSRSRSRSRQGGDYEF